MNHLLTVGCIAAYLVLGYIIVAMWRAIRRRKNLRGEGNYESEENSGQGY